MHKLAAAMRGDTAEAMYIQLLSHWTDPASVVIGGVEPTTVLTDPTALPQLDQVVECMAFLDTLTYLPDDIATVCYLVFDPAAGILSFANAGHLPPLLVRRGGIARLLGRAVGPPLGADPGYRYRHVQVPVEPDDTVLLYTDGLVERRDRALDTGLTELAEAAAAAGDLSPETWCRMLVDRQHPATFTDDRALLVVRFVHGRPAPADGGRAPRAVPAEAPGPR